MNQLLTTAEWVLWGLAVFIALSLTYGAIKRLRAGQPVMKATLYQGIFLWLVAAFLLLMPSVSKLHLVWVIPVCFPLIGYITFKLASKTMEREAVEAEKQQ